MMVLGGESCSLPRSTHELRQSRCAEWEKKASLPSPLPWRKDASGPGETDCEIPRWKGHYGSRTAAAEYAQGSQDWLHPWIRESFSEVYEKWGAEEQAVPWKGPIIELPGILDHRSLVQTHSKLAIYKIRIFNFNHYTILSCLQRIGNCLIHLHNFTHTPAPTNIWPLKWDRVGW